MENEDAVAVESKEIQDAKDSPAGMKVSLSGPDVISVVEDNNSPSLNVDWILSNVPDEIY